MRKSETIDLLATALSKAQSKIKGAKADSENPFFKSHYADLASIWDAIRIPLSENGLSITQTTEKCIDGVDVETTLMHTSGQWLSGNLWMPAEKFDAQTFGKLMTYARRYALSAIIGVPQIDDDAESTMNRKMAPENVKRPGIDQESCSHVFLQSKYNEEEIYCKLCKLKKRKEI